MKQVVRNLTDESDGFLLHSRYLIMDRDTKYSQEFRDYLDREDVKPVRCPVRAPNCNAFAERFVRSIKDECLDRIILFGEASLRRALREYVAHFRSERSHPEYNDLVFALYRLRVSTSRLAEVNP